MSSSQPTFRGLATVARDQIHRDDKGRWAVNADPLSDRNLVTRAKQPIPNVANITDIVAIDAEFQNAYVAALGKQRRGCGSYYGALS